MPDCNGDDVPDLVVGSPYENGGGVARGRVEAFSGMDGTRLWSTEGKRDGEHFGMCLTLMPSSGRPPRLIVGAPEDDGCIQSAAAKIQVTGRVYELDARDGSTGRYLSATDFEEPFRELGLVVDCRPSPNDGGHPILIVANRSGRIARIEWPPQQTPIQSEVLVWQPIADLGVLSGASSAPLLVTNVLPFESHKGEITLYELPGLDRPMRVTPFEYEVETSPKLVRCAGVIQTGGKSGGALLLTNGDHDVEFVDREPSCVWTFSTHRREERSRLKADDSRIRGVVDALGRKEVTFDADRLGSFGCSTLVVSDQDHDGTPDVLATFTAWSVPNVPNGKPGLPVRCASGVLVVLSGKDLKPLRALCAVISETSYGDGLAEVADVDGDSVPDIVVSRLRDVEQPSMVVDDITLLSGATLESRFAIQFRTGEEPRVRRP